MNGKVRARKRHLEERNSIMLQLIEHKGRTLQRHTAIQEATSIK
jgi:hypothetical protein